MRALLWLTVLAFAGWSGWWWVASGAARTGAETTLATMQAQGWQVDHDGLSVAGYPNRIDLTANAPRLDSPDGRWGWSAAFAQVFALSYKPWHLIAVFPPEQTLRTPVGPWALWSDSLRSSLVLVPGSDLALDRFQLSGEALRLGGGVATGADSLSFATRPAVGEALAHDVGLDIRNIHVDPRLTATLPPGLLPDRAAVVRLDAVAGFNRPLDRHALTTPPRLTGVTVREARAEWGAIRLHLSGRLAPDAAGFAEGQLDLRLEGAQTALELAVATGLIAPNARGTWAAMLASVAPGATPVTLPLRLSRGMVSLGPLPLGPAPRMVW
ncbi:MAG: DUF2125 domain-containing protein [Gemmobacter sp.]|jgi:hypothetical protein|nr:DUF2125 domain-containing protein [Gemmobacter sp.]